MMDYFTEKFLTEQQNGVTMIDYPFQIRPGVFALLRLPVDLTVSEIERLRAMMLTLVETQESEAEQ